MKGTVVAGVVGLVAGLAGPGAAQAAEGLPTRPAAGAVMVGWHEDGDDVDALRVHEAELGTRFALVRMYQQWQLPSRRVAAMIGDGRLVLVSHKPPAGGWAAVASGAEDPMIRALASAYRSFGREVLFSFHHEPHDDASDVKGGSSGTAADYREAWRRIRTLFEAERASHTAGGNVFFAYSATASWALKAAAGGPPGSGDPLYPGDGLVDVFAHDRYNWASCRGDSWEQFGPEWAPLVQLAAAHGKPLMAAEFGSAPAGGARNDWFRHAAEWLRTDPLARRWMWGFAYFHSLHDTCPWDFLNQGDDGRLGWRDAFRDPYFTGTPFSLRSGATAPIVGGAGGSAPPPLAPTPQPPSPRKPRPPTTTTTTTTTTTPATTAATSGPVAGTPETSAAPGGTATPDAPGTALDASPSPAPASIALPAANPAEPAMPAGRSDQPPDPPLDPPFRPGWPAVVAMGLLAVSAIARRVLNG